MNQYSWLSLPEEDQALFGNEAGSGWTEKLVPEMVYTSFGQHDFYYGQGGSIVDKFRADFFLFGFMIVDGAKQPHVIQMFWYALVALIYFLGLSILGLLFFPYGQRKTAKEAVEQRKKQIREEK